MNGGSVAAVKNFNALSLRVARQHLGCAAELYPLMFDRRGRLASALIVSPPRCGKTTILRDLTRMLSDGAGQAGVNVSLVDERSELAGTYQGIPQLDVGIRTDVLDACPKALGVMMALRALAPALVTTDEIGREEDARALREGVCAGVAILASAHGDSLEDISRRPGLKALLAADVFHTIIFLSRRRGPGTVEDVIRRHGYAVV
jgi:stage III sporulation protein AA